MSAEGALTTAFLGPLFGAQVENMQQQKKAQKRAERRQDAANRQVESRAAAEVRRQEQEHRRLNKRKPDISALLGAERQAANQGPGATVLTGATGVSRQRTTLGGSSLLGVA